LTVEPQNRYDEEAQFLEKAFKGLKFFKELEQQLDQESFKKLFRKLRLLTHGPDEKICSDGDYDFHLHTIVSGTVEAQTMEHQAPDSDNRLLRSNARIIKSLSPRRVVLAKEGPTILKKFFKGDSFGGIINDKPEERRKIATVYMSKTETVCAIIKHKDYSAIIEEAYAKKHSVNISFLGNLRIFQHWNHHQVTSLVRCSEEVRFNRNQILFKEGEQGDSIYFIKDGEVELQKMIEFENKDRDESVDENLPVLRIGKISSTFSRPKTFKRSIRVLCLGKQTLLTSSR